MKWYNKIVRRNILQLPEREKGVYMKTMNMSEAARLIIGLRSAGWNEKDINDFILFIETGEEQYKPKEREKAD